MSQFSLPKPHAKQLEVFNDEHRFKVLNWGRRSGKSTMAYLYTMVQAITHQGLYYIIAPNYKQAKSIYWDDVAKVYTPKSLVKFNEVELSVTFPYLDGPVILPNGKTMYVKHDPNLAPSKIVFKGAEDPDSLRGVGINGAVLDEYAFMRHGKNVYDKIVRPALADRQGWCIWISTPDGVQNHFYDLCQLAQEESDKYFFSHATAQHNPYFPPEEFEEARKQHEKEGKADEFYQEWLAEFVQPSTLVYKDFRRDIHVFNDPDLIPQNGTYAIGIDFGFTDPTAAVFVKIDYDNNWYIYDELYQPGLTTDQTISILRNKMGDNVFSRVIGDAAARQEIENMKRKRFPITGGKKGKDTIKAGIREVSAMLRVREATGKPKLFVHASCKNVIREFESYRNMTDAWGQAQETPEDKNNHAMDALRYLVLDHVEHRKRPKREKIYDKVTGRLIGYSPAGE